MKKYTKAGRPLSARDITKETPEERLKRVQNEKGRFKPKVFEDKTKYNRKRIKSNEFI